MRPLPLWIEKEEVTSESWDRIDENGRRSGDAGQRVASLPSRFVFSPLAGGKKHRRGAK